MVEATPVEIHEQDVFREWLHGLRDSKARARISERLFRLERGNPGEIEPVGKGVTEMKIDYGPGYRVYYVARGKSSVEILCGGDKANQDRDIITAKAMAQALRELRNETRKRKSKR